MCRLAIRCSASAWNPPGPSAEERPHDLSSSNACSKTCRCGVCRRGPNRRTVETVARFARHFGRSPAGLGLEETRAYQVYLTNERRLAASSLVVAVSALRFLYRVTLRKRWVLRTT